MPSSGDATEHSADEGSFDDFLKRVARVSAPQPVSPRAGLPVGAKLAGGRFEIVGQVGAGGMGVVYEAHDAERRSRVALKTLTRMDAGEIYRLKNEFRVLADVSHPNLVRLYELFSDDQGWFFSMELVKGERFDRCVRDEQSLRAALSQLVSAVTAIHGAGKLHRDLKPSNVLIEADGRVVVLDFGLVADTELGGVGQTIADESVSGTPAYMAPEQAAGRAATQASDWYALGVMLFEALTGRLPFDGRSGEILAAKQTRAAPSPRDLVPQAPGDLSALCAALLAREPEQRPTGSQLVSRMGQPAGAASSASRPPEPSVELVGREADFEVLRDAYRASVEGSKPVVVLMSGESGIGKSALCEAFLAELRAEGRALVFFGRCYERESVPFKALDAIVDELSRHLRKLPERELLHLMPREAFALSRLFPVLGRVPAFAAAPERRLGDAHELRRRGFAALAELLGRLRDLRPLVLCIDDLQWSDRDSTTLLMHVLRQPDAPPFLFVMSHRSEGMADNPVLEPLHAALPLDIRLDCRVHSLPPLSEDGARVLLGAAADESPQVASEAGGNAYLLSEIGHYARTHGNAPASLASAIEERVAQLPSLERAFLEVLAVAARPIGLDIAAEAAGVEGAHEAFDRLRVARLARAAAGRGSVECYHDKIRESVAASLSAATRAAYHGCLARALSVRAAADPEHLAQHFLEAGERDKAAEHAIPAARRAEAAFAFGRAAAFYEIALSAGRFDAAMTHALRVGHAKALAEDGQGLGAGEAYLLAAEGKSGDEALDLRREAGMQFLAAGYWPRGTDLMREAVAAVGGAMPETTGATVASAMYHRARLRLRGLDFRERPSIDDRVRRKYETLHLVASALSLCNADKTMVSASLAAQALRLALEVGDAGAVADQLPNHLWFSILFGVDFAHRERIAEQATALCARIGRPEILPAVNFSRGVSTYSRHPGRYHPEALKQALGYLDSALEVLREHPFPYGYGSYMRQYINYQRGFARMLLGGLAEVAREVPLRIEEARARSNMVMMVCWAGGMMPARIAVEDLAEAERDLERAHAMWRPTGYSGLDPVLANGDVYLPLYQGKPGLAWERIERHWAELQASSMRRMALFPSMLAGPRAFAALGLAAEMRDTGKREALHRIAKDMAKLSFAERGVIQAGLAFQRGDRERGIEALRVSVASGSPFPWPAQRVLGELVGGDEGQRLVAEADTRLREAGVKDPARYARAMLPGFSQI